MTILLGIAKQLAYTPPTRGEVVLLFQPAEETGAGARAIIESENFDASLCPDVAYALHNQPGRPFGEISIREGAFACASRGMIVRLHGQCSHAAHPEQGRSPAHVMCNLLERLEQLPQRLPPSIDLRLVTIVHAQLGEVAFGTTPGEAVVMVTLRTATDALMLPLVEAARELVEEETQKAGLTYEIEFRDVFAAVFNDQKATADVIQCAHKHGKMVTMLQAPNRWSEDFGVYSAVCRSSMFLLGAGEAMYVLHDSAYDFPDALIEHGVEMFWALLNEQRLFDN
jgi:amidohydrolase